MKALGRKKYEEIMAGMEAEKGELDARYKELVEELGQKRRQLGEAISAFKTYAQFAGLRKRADVGNNGGSNWGGKRVSGLSTIRTEIVAYLKSNGPASYREVREAMIAGGRTVAKSSIPTELTRMKVDGLVRSVEGTKWGLVEGGTGVTTDAVTTGAVIDVATPEGAFV